MRQQPWPCKESGGRSQPASLKRHTSTSKDTVDTDHFIYNLDLMDTSNPIYCVTIHKRNQPR